jgi:hypothetical protein
MNSTGCPGQDWESGFTIFSVNILLRKNMQE